VPWIVLVGGVLLTATTGVLLQRALESRDRARFESNVQSTANQIEGRFHAYEALLRGAAGLFAASEQVTREEFRTWVSRVELDTAYPGTQGLGYVERVEARDLARLQATAEAEGVRFLPRPDTARDIYLPILFLEPLTPMNAVALGYDMFTESTRREAMQRAWLTGRPALSGPVTLVQEAAAADPPQPGFLVYLALYDAREIPASEDARRARLRGFVYSPFRAWDFFRELFPGEGAHRVAFRLRDEASDTVLFDSGWDLAEGARRATTPLQLGGRTWVLECRPTAKTEGSPPWVVPGLAAFGVLASGIFFVLVHAQGRARTSAEEAARARQRSEQELRLVIDALPVIVLYVDRLTGLRYHNRAYERYMEGRTDPVLLARLLGVETVEEARARLEPVFRGESLAVDAAVGEGTSARDLHTLCVPDRDESGGVRGFVALVMDMTESKRSERALRAAVKLRDDFLQVASHELKTPLTPLSLKLQLLLRELAARGQTDETERERRHLEMALRQVGKVADLVNDLLDVSRIDSGRLRMQLGPVDLAQVVRDVVARLEGQAQQAGVVLHLDVSPCVGTWDGKRLEQVVVNLLDNALKYGAGYPVEVRLSCRGGEAELVVEDHGIGISPEGLGRIFQRFERAVSERSYGGLGLGLYIVQGIVSALRGDVSVVSELGKGARFTVRLPLQPSVASPSAEPSAAGAPGDSGSNPMGEPGRL
jgi:signal transduction histidine kinase/CHASE1-domain containing sensor protein